MSYQIQFNFKKFNKWKEKHSQKYIVKYLQRHFSDKYIKEILKMAKLYKKTGKCYNPNDKNVFRSNLKSIPKI